MIKRRSKVCLKAFFLLKVPSPRYIIHLNLLAQAAVLQSSVPASLGLNENNFCHNPNTISIQL